MVLPTTLPGRIRSRDAPISASNWFRKVRAKFSFRIKTPASTFRSCAHSVKLADVTNAISSSTMMLSRAEQN